jgi:predicted small integral membrane protein
MNALTTALANGTITILILALTIFEAAGLLIYHRLTANGPRLKAFLPNLLAGDFLLLAWLTSATHQPWPLTAASLAAAFAAHLTDLSLRWS